jgi:hypothetical protein
MKAEMSHQARLLVLEFDWSACSEKFEKKLYDLVRARSKKREVQSV